MCCGSCCISLGLLDFLQITFDVSRVRVGIYHCRRTQVVGRALVLRAFVGTPLVPPVNGYADLEGLLAGDGHLPDALGDHRLAIVAGAGTGNLDLVATFDLQLSGKFKVSSARASYYCKAMVTRSEEHTSELQSHLNL